MYASSSPRERAASATLAAIMVAAIGWAFASGLGARFVAHGGEALQTFGVLPVPPPPPPERVVPKRQKLKRPEGAAAPPNLRSHASEVVAPVPILPPPVPPPILAARDPGIGADATQGAADRPGPGSGAGGIGNGTGSGRWGDGDGDGYADETPPRRIKGRLKYSDYPDDAPEPGPGGVTVGVRYYVEVDGRPTHCTVTHSSGIAALDATTCRLIEQRFRYRPSRDGYGRPVRSVVVVDHEWASEADPAPRD